MLEQGGVKVLRCSRLKQQPDAKYRWKTAAFFVSCEESCQDTFYNEAIWPEGAELRDWYGRPTLKMEGNRVLRIATYNSHGFKGNRLYLQTLLKKHDIVFVQELWLMECEMD